MSEESFEQSLFAVIEYLSGMELRNTSKMLIRQYYRSSKEPDAKGKAIETIVRYLQIDLSSKVREDDQHLRELIRAMIVESIHIADREKG